MLRFTAAGMLAGLGHVFVELINLQTVRNFDVYLPACHYVFAALVSCTGNAVVLAVIFRLRYHWAIRWYCLLALCFASSVVALSVEALFLQGLTVHENERTALERDAPHTFTIAQVLLLLAVRLFIGIHLLNPGWSFLLDLDLLLSLALYTTQTAQKSCKTSQACSCLLQ